tara:strand:- start:635 stop:1444 length:810 start_codon:yes stop_codon:yes gene_type:complete
MIQNSKLILIFSCLFITNIVDAQEVEKESAAELAKKLANPIASLISVPFQNNMDVGIGDSKASKNTMNIQPVIPFRISDSLSLITRWVQPVVSQHNISGLGNSEFGLGDAVVSAFLSPSTTKKGVTWGVGPVLLIPTATNEFMASKKFGVGPTVVALRQSNGITLGGLVNQIWSIAGDNDKNDVNQMFIQPFFTYNWKSGAGMGGSFEITQNWEANNTTVWFIPTISGVTSLGSQKTQFFFGPRFNLAAPNGKKADFGIRAGATFLFVK